MIKVGLIGEDPNDTQAIKNLISQKFGDRLSFKHLIKNRKGYQLDNKRVQDALKIEFENYQPRIVLFIRDADGCANETEKKDKVLNWFLKLNPVVNQRGILLMNIYELEALILADIETFNKIYNINIKIRKNVMFQEEPKEFLKLKTKNCKKKYFESDCPELFKSLRFDSIYNNCKYFSDFIVILKKTGKLQ